MTRIKIVKSTFGGRPDRSKAEIWEHWLENKHHCSLLGQSVSKELNRRLVDRIDEVDKDNNAFREENRRLQEVKDYLELNGIPLNTYHPVRELEKKLKGQFKTVRFITDRAIIALEAMRDALDKEIGKE